MKSTSYCCFSFAIIVELFDESMLSSWFFSLTASLCGCADVVRYGTVVPYYSTGSTQRYRYYYR